MSWRLTLYVVLLGLTVGLSTACSRPTPGWQPLWRDSWQRNHKDTRWDLGVGANGRSFEVLARALRMRARVQNLGLVPASLHLTGPRTSLQWRLEPGEILPLDLATRIGSYSFQAPAEIVLNNPRLGQPLPQPRRLVFMLADTLRADHVRPDLTPSILDAFGPGSAWSQAWANASWTLPSMTSIFTARPVLDLTTPEGDLIGIPEGMPTLAGQFSQAGFSCAAVVANHTIHVLNGFAEGFDSFVVPDGHGSRNHRDASWVVRHGKAWLDSHQGEDVFLYLHFMDPHEPYRSHGQPGPELPDLEPLAHRRRRASPEEATLYGQRYAGEVKHLDRALTGFFGQLTDDVVVAFTSDHGEILGEHECWGHGLTLHEEVVRVPLLLKGPGVPRQKIAQPAQLLDLGPTLLRLMGCAVPSSMKGRSLLEGGSDLPIVAATFGPGPLRWAWRQGPDKVVVRMMAQPGLGVEARSKMDEGEPLPAGIFHINLDSDPGQERPSPPTGILLEQAGQVFSLTAGQMVPGLQLVAWGEDRRVEIELEVQGVLDVIQAWSGSPMRIHREGDRLLVSCDNALPLCAVAARVDPRPGWIRWLGDRSEDTRVPVAELQPPQAITGGPTVWWNPERARIVGGHSETLEKLRALGYIR